MDHNDLDHLKKRLLLPLPGKEAQYRLAPSYRPSMDDNDPKHFAGVTILLYHRGENLYFPLIERPQYDGVHSGQISFPGGKMDYQDRNLIVTALRECEEEIGIDSSKTIVLGSLTNLIIPVSRFDVYPTIAYYQEEPVFIPQESEVASILEVPLNTLLSDDVIIQKKVFYNGIEETVPYFNLCNKMVWGATAMILSEFIQIWNESISSYSETKFL